MTPASRTATRRSPEIDVGTLADQLHSQAIHLLRSLRRHDVDSGLSAPRLSALSVLVFGGPKSLKELADAEQVRPPSMSRLVKSLEADGLVARDTDIDDGRVVRFRATARATRLLREGRRRRTGSLAVVLDALSAAELERLAAGATVLATIVQRLREDS